MKHRITHEKPLFRLTGVDLIVHLQFEPHEEKLIYENNLKEVIIVEQDPTTKYVIGTDGKKEKKEEDNNIRFKDFYERRTSWHVDSVLEAKDLHAKLFEGFKRFEQFLQINAKPGETTEGDFAPKPPPEFTLGLIQDYMWAQHAYVLAESGGGKTQLLQTIFAQQMRKPKPPGFVIIDSENKMLPLIKKKFPQAIMIDPVDNPPSLDLFNPHRLAKSGIHTTLDTFRYLFNSGDEPLTGRQNTPFEYAIALMLQGYPKAYGQSATIEDLEDYLNGSKKGLELSARAHKAVDAMPDHLKSWYYSQYANFRDSHSYILQRLSNICGPFTPLRPLFNKQHDTLNIVDTIANGGIILVNTNRHLLGPRGSSFFGRFFFKLLDGAIGDRNLQSHPLFFMVDEVHQYFDETVITPFTDLARKRNISCIFAHQRLAQLNKQPELRDALTGVGTLIATNVNPADIKEIAGKFFVEMEQVHAWRREFREGHDPKYADFGLYLKGKHAAETFRLTFGQLEAATSGKHEQHSRADEQPRQEQHQKANTGPPLDDEYDHRYDILESLPLNPNKAKTGFIWNVRAPDRRTYSVNIPAGTKNGARFCVKGASGIRRPDNCNGNYWIEVHVPEMSGAGAKKDDGREEI